MDFGWAAFFLLVTEALSLPLRVALLRTRAPADVRRVLSRAAGPVLLALPIWWLGHAAGVALSRSFGLCVLGLLVLAAGWSLRGGGPGRGVARALADQVIPPRAPGVTTRRRFSPVIG